MRLSLPLQLLLPVVLALTACSKPQTVEEPIRAVRTLTLQPGSTALQHEYAGEIRARTETRLSFQVSGKLVARTVNVGDQVAVGRTLARLDARDLELGQDAARAALTAANAQLSVNEAEFKRYQELKAQGFISGMELERREAALKAARAQAEQAVAQVTVQRNQTGYARLVAAVSGVVTAVDAEPGAVLSAGMPVLRVALDGPRDVVFSVPEGRVASLRALVGKAGALRVRLWGANEVLAATVRELAAVADPATRTFLVKADLGAADVRLGQTATVLLEAPATPTLKLPLHAVFGQGEQSTVWLVDRNSMTVRPQPVVLGGADGNLVLVAQGLQPGDVVVTAGVHALVKGQKVRWYVEPAVAAATGRPVAPAAATAASAGPASR